MHGSWSPRRTGRPARWEAVVVTVARGDQLPARPINRTPGGNLMSWITDIWALFNTGISDFAGLGLQIMQLPFIIADIFIQIFNIGMYMMALFVNTTIEILNALMFPFGQFFDNLIGFGNSLFQVVGVFVGTFPSEWTFLLTAIIGVNIALRIYSLIPAIGRR